MALTPESALAKDKRTGLAEMQHRHFATIATILESIGTESDFLHPEDFDSVCGMFTDELAHTNPKFDRDRFLKACGVM